VRQRARVGSWLVYHNKERAVGLDTSSLDSQTIQNSSSGPIACPSGKRSSCSSLAFPRFAKPRQDSAETGPANFLQFGLRDVESQVWLTHTCNPRMSDCSFLSHHPIPHHATHSTFSRFTAASAMPEFLLHPLRNSCVPMPQSGADFTLEGWKERSEYCCSNFPVGATKVFV